jgi:hypothetical protein
MDEVGSEGDDSVDSSGAREKLYILYNPSIQYDWMDLYRKSTLRTQESEKNQIRISSGSYNTYSEYIILYGEGRIQNKIPLVSGTLQPLDI